MDGVGAGVGLAGGEDDETAVGGPVH
jgi:hypothetical protein